MRLFRKGKGGEVKCFIVSSKDVFDKRKNPKLSLSVKDILANKKIKKRPFKQGDLKNGSKTKKHGNSKQK